MTSLEKDAMAWAAARDFINHLHQYKDALTPQQLRTLRGQALAGDVPGARRGLKRLTEGRP